MTTIAGLNIRGRIWRYTNPVDDDQGGSVPTGTVLYEPVWSRIREERPTFAILQQGLETTTIYTALLGYVAYSATGTFDVRSNDQYEVDFPPISPHYGKRFIILDAHPAEFNDGRRYLTATLRRLEIANSNLLQA